MNFNLLKILIHKKAFIFCIFRLEIKKKVFILFAIQFASRFKVFIICGMGFERDFNDINLVLFGKRYKVTEIKKEVKYESKDDNS